MAGIVAVFVLLSSIPKEIWLLIGIVAIAVVAFKAFANKSEPPISIQANSRATAPVRNKSDLPAPYPIRVASLPISSSTWSERKIPPPASGEVAQKARWVPIEEIVEIAGLKITGGMVYVGLNLRSESGQQDPALINPNLQVSRDFLDISERRTSHWPSYSGISPEARRAYLQWLASGRRDPKADIGYVFLFFYGLERRALIDAAQFQDDIATIIDEIKNLLAIYGDNNSFRHYASSFLNYVSASELNTDPNNISSPPDVEPEGFELPFAFRVGLAKFAAARRSVPVAWALKWSLMDPMITRRTPIERCRAEFEKIFPYHYSQNCGEGLLLPLNKTKLQVNYQPASSGFYGKSFSRAIGNLPDVSAVTGPQKKLQQVVDDCTAELDRYSRFLGRYPNEKNSLEAAAFLPVHAWPNAVASGVQHIKDELTTGELLIRWKDLLKRLGEERELSRGAVVLLATRLEEFGIAIEPDFPRGAGSPREDDTVVLFLAPPSVATSMRSAGSYAAACLMLDLGSMMALADGVASPPEIQLLTRTIETWGQLDGCSRQRLKARLRLQVVHPTTIASIKKRLELLSAESRRTIADILVDVAHADGVVSPEEVKLLEKTYKVLQLDPKQVYVDIHEGPQRDAASRPSTGKRFALDTNKIARLQQETEQISAVLGDVFAEEPKSQPPELEKENDFAVSDTLLGLDVEHSCLARLLLSRRQWSRGELVDAAADMELMLDGALERINEAAFDKFDMPLTDGDDPVEINRDILEKVTA